MKAATQTAVFAAIFATLALAGCASTPEPSQELAASAAPGAASTSDADPKAEITGSRIPARRSEKMVSQIGGKDYNDNKSALPAPLRSN
jgi:outer membrane murein-binding lipoprotein Lpp